MSSNCASLRKADDSPKNWQRQETGGDLANTDNAEEVDNIEYR